MPGCSPTIPSGLPVTHVRTGSPAGGGGRTGSAGTSGRIHRTGPAGHRTIRRRPPATRPGAPGPRAPARVSGPGAGHRTPDGPVRTLAAAPVSRWAAPETPRVEPHRSRPAATGGAPCPGPDPGRRTVETLGVAPGPLGRASACPARDRVAPRRTRTIPDPVPPGPPRGAAAATTTGPTHSAPAPAGPGCPPTARTPAAAATATVCRTGPGCGAVTAHTAPGRPIPAAAPAPPVPHPAGRGPAGRRAAARGTGPRTPGRPTPGGRAPAPTRPGSPLPGRTPRVTALPATARRSTRPARSPPDRPNRAGRAGQPGRPGAELPDSASLRAATATATGTGTAAPARPGGGCGTCWSRC
ncbi:hypothetical protein C8E95_0249 [Pseudonocardia autotrophica]|uniref:Uncharacterized protein n=1 Tax=Pseudonocardia autotrophica TaxID=2074 RepID=A0A1Y2N2M8_PSEAH|nr:hypothetical protein BG845_01754 [Pseudonocardia autotrophica]TDN71222.1 hypothetical protein C8E95_0249 [Pseudonocardia autotrophica]